MLPKISKKGKKELFFWISMESVGGSNQKLIGKTKDLHKRISIHQQIQRITSWIVQIFLIQMETLVRTTNWKTDFKVFPCWTQLSTLLQLESEGNWFPPWSKVSLKNSRIWCNHINTTKKLKNSNDFYESHIKIVYNIFLYYIKSIGSIFY